MYSLRTTSLNTIFRAVKKQINIIHINNNASISITNVFHKQSQRNFSAGIVQHRDTPGNTQNDTFDFTTENYDKVKTILSKFPNNYKQSAIIPLLQLAQEQNDNWLTLAAMNKVAEIVSVPQIRVYEVATFYTQFNREKVGKFHIQVCGTTPCQLCGAESLIDTVTRHLGIKLGETTKDGMFTMTEVECLGACANAPMIQINNHEFYENLTPESLIKLLDDLKSGKKVKVGPQNGQQSCEGIQGQTTLKKQTDISQYYRNLDDIIKQVKAENDKKAQEAQKAKA